MIHRKRNLAALWQLCLASGVGATPFRGVHARDTTAPVIEWGTCQFSTNSTQAVECGTLPVPLDYANEQSTETLDLALIRILANSQPSKGSIIFNFGGPGVSGVTDQWPDLAPTLTPYTGEDYDYISFDPRGVGSSLPFSCFDTAEGRSSFFQKFPNLPRTASDVALGRSWAFTEHFNDVCVNATKDYGELIGTAYAARDVMQIVDAVESDGMLRFWGLSYGTVLGSTIAAMFPDRVERMFIDSVVNVHNYYNTATLDLDQGTATGATLRAMLDECVAVGEKCSLTQLNSTASAMETSLMRAVESYRHNPAIVNDTIIDDQFAETLIFTILKGPKGPWNPYMNTFKYLINREELDIVVTVYNGLVAPLPDEALQGVKCGDTIARYDNLADLQWELDYVKQTSGIGAGSIEPTAMSCARWPLHAKERYLGNFQAKTRTPILLGTNAYDVATPPMNAYNMSSGFAGSKVVVQQGFGHGIINNHQQSNCTIDIVRKYFEGGSLPEKNTVCEIDTHLFP